MKKASMLYEKLICVSFVCVIFLGLELGARLIFLHEERIECILSVLQQDSALFWRQKSYLNTLFANAHVKTNDLGFRDKKIGIKKKDTFRIICLGASPTFGWGVDIKDTYPYKLEQLIRKNSFQKQNIEVINAGMIGYSSYQGMLLFKEKIVDLDPDLITIAYVINDVDKYRFYMSSNLPDNKLENKNKTLVKIENILQCSKFVSVFRKLIIKLQNRAALNGRGNSRWIYRQQPRVSADEYAQNLKAIIRLAQTKGIQVVFLKMPVNLPVAVNVGKKLKILSKKCIIKAKSFAQSKNFSEATAMLSQAIRYNPYDSEAYYFLGLCHERVRNFVEAKKCFQKQIENELFECSKLAKRYNEIMENTAIEENVVLVNVVGEFAEFSQNSDEYLFLDPNHDTIHPNSIGHAIIGKALFKSIKDNELINN